MKREAVEVKFSETPEHLQRALLVEFGSEENMAQAGVKLFRFRGTKDFAVVKPGFDA